MVIAGDWSIPDDVTLNKSNVYPARPQVKNCCPREKKNGAEELYPPNTFFQIYLKNAVLSRK